MDLFPLYNSLRIALFSSVLVFFSGIFVAWHISRMPKFLKGIFDVILTLPMVLPPTVIGYFLLLIFSTKRPFGAFLQDYGIKFVMTWYGGIISAFVVSFPLMYRTSRGAFESFDVTLREAGRTLGLKKSFIFWHIELASVKDGILAGIVLSFARALGEYGATSMLVGYTPRHTATISTTVYQLWRIGNDELAYKWVLVNVAISVVVLFAVNLLESRKKKEGRK